MIEKLYEILTELYNKANKPFPGLGLLICDDIGKIPISSLYNTTPNYYQKNLLDQLLDLSNYQNLHHDGFHILSTDLKITHSAQYFYPQPKKGFLLNANDGHGVRYFVAQLGSMLPDIKYTAIVGGKYGVCIFKDGKEIKVENHD